ncbi:MAG TPA: peptidylprolyl isomerase [Stellaceae bacterium]|nr:peptidylprolyl isomerase [Stellaceae bacterium]
MIRLLLAVFCLALAAPAFAQETRIAAVVNDEAISVSDLAARMQLIMAASRIPDTPENRQRLGRQILRTLIDEKLEMQEAKRLNISVSDAEVNDAFNRLEAQNKLPKGGLDEFLKQHGVDRSTLVDQITASIAWGKTVRATLAQQVQVSDEEVDATMARLKENENAPRSRVAEIFLAVDSPQQDEEVHHFADRLIEQLHSGGNFPQIAQQFSQSPTAAVGGDMGWIIPSELSPELAAAVNRMKPGELSEPIRAAGGYYIILVIDKQAAGGGIDDEKVSLMQVMFPLPANAPESEKQRVAAAAASVSKEARSCGELAQIGRQQAPQTSGDLGWVRVGDLPPGLRPTVHALKIAEASPPVPLQGGLGVLMVCDRQASPGALPTRQQVMENLEQEKFETLAQRYLRDLRRQAFIDIRA